MAPVTKPSPMIRPLAKPARPAMSSCASISVRGAVEAAEKPTRIAHRKPAGPGNATNNRTAGTLATSEARIIARRPKRSASEPVPTVPNALASTTVVASGP